RSCFSSRRPPGTRAAQRNRISPRPKEFAFRLMASSSVHLPHAQLPDLMNPRERPIGVFDSGIGGLTVVRALRQLLPNETIFYLGYMSRVPYGNKSAETVERYSLELARILMAENAKLIVVACNTVSSVAIPKLRA